MFLLLEAERILLYYKTMKGTILAEKSIDSPQWVQWIHHDEGKHIVKYACNLTDGISQKTGIRRVRITRFAIVRWSRSTMPSSE